MVMEGRYYITPKGEKFKEELLVEHRGITKSMSLLRQDRGIVPEEAGETIDTILDRYYFLEQLSRPGGYDFSSEPTAFKSLVLPQLKALEKGGYVRFVSTK